MYIFDSQNVISVIYRGMGILTGIKLINSLNLVCYSNGTSVVNGCPYQR